MKVKSYTIGNWRCFQKCYANLTYCEEMAILWVVAKADKFDCLLKMQTALAEYLNSLHSKMTVKIKHGTGSRYINGSIGSHKLSFWHHSMKRCFLSVSTQIYPSNTVFENQAAEQVA